MINLFKILLGENFTRLHYAIEQQNLSCDSRGETENRSKITFASSDIRQNLRIVQLGQNIYAFLIPFVIVIGLVGNCLSLRVFTSKMMWKISASFYLAALALCDMGVLSTYVLFDWLNKGLPQWPGHYRFPLVAKDGICETFLFLTYTFRFLSVWIIVVFTVERYIGVCKPLRRREMCTKTFAHRAIASLVCLAFAISLYKPLLSRVNKTSYEHICAWKKEHENLNFVLDTIYALLITVVPFIIMVVLNILIVRKLLHTRRRHKRAKFLGDESVVKLEFTFILLAVSTCFMILNLPYIIVWCMRFQSELSHLMGPDDPTATAKARGLLYIMKTIFCINYCINFFLYSLTGLHFRKHLKILCTPSNLERAGGTAFSRSLFSNMSTPTASPRSSLV